MNLIDESVPFNTAATSTMDKYKALHLRVTEKVADFLDEKAGEGVTEEALIKRCDSLKNYWTKRMNKYKKSLKVSNLTSFYR